MTKENAFISNRYVAKQPLIALASGYAELSLHWFVSDTSGPKGTGNAREYASPDCEFRIGTGYGYWVVCNDRGQWLKMAKPKDGRKAMPRRFKTPLAAAKAAEALDGSESFA